MHDIRLLPFLDRHVDSDLHTLTRAVETAARAEGFWQIPPELSDLPRQRDWPCTVFYEVQLYGVVAHGFTPDEVASNWRKVALNFLKGQLADQPQENAA